jgi:hypothetical protein
MIVKYKISILLIFVSVCLLAQKPKVKNEPNHDDRPVHFGFSLGLNAMDFRIRQSFNDSASGYDPNVVADVSVLQPGFHVHAISNVRLGKFFDLRVLPGISFGGERIITYTDRDTINRKGYTPVSIESNFIELPILIKYKSTRINNFRTYLIGGANFRFDLAATNKIWGDAEVKKENKVILNVFDNYLEFGFGMDFYLEYFKFTTEIKYSIGMRNMIKKSVRTSDGIISINDQKPELAMYSNVIDRLNSRMFMISFHFE